MWHYHLRGKKPQKLNARNQAAWMRSYEHLLKFVKREGHARIPRRHKEGNFWLRSWVDRQRAKWRDGELLEEHRLLLDKVPGWDWGREGMAQMPDEEEPRRGGHEWNYIVIGDEYRTSMLHAVLLGKGAMPYEEAVQLAIKELFQQEFEPKRHLRKGGRAQWLVNRAIQDGIRKNKLDQPEPGLLRSVQRNARMYIEEDWEQCIHLCDFKGTEIRDEMVQKVLEKAVELMGLDLSTIQDARVSLERLEKVITENG